MRCDPDHPSNSESGPFVSCSQTEAVEIAISTAVISHLVFCFLTVALFASPNGILWGFGLAVGFAFGFPFVVLPIAVIAGMTIHYLFQGTTVSIPILTRILMILFEACLFGWVLVFCFAG